MGSNASGRSQQAAEDDGLFTPKVSIRKKDLLVTESADQRRRLHVAVADIAEGAVVRFDDRVVLTLRARSVGRAVFLRHISTLEPAYIKSTICLSCSFL